MNASMSSWNITERWLRAIHPTQVDERRNVKRNRTKKVQKGTRGNGNEAGSWAGGPLWTTLWKQMERRAFAFERRRFWSSSLDHMREIGKGQIKSKLKGAKGSSRKPKARERATLIYSVSHRLERIVEPGRKSTRSAFKLSPIDIWTQFPLLAGFNLLRVEFSN